MNFDGLGNAEIQRELGRRLRRERLNQNISQTVLAKQAGISRRTLVAAEKGDGPTMETFLSILRALNLLQRIDQMLPEPSLSPVDLVKFRGRERKHASKPKRTGKPVPRKWTWDD